jgi:hypothetical protein
MQSGQETAMASTTAARQTSASSVSSDLSALKIRQQAAWSSGNYAVVGTTLQIVGEQLCETLDLRAGARVLDVAAGNGMVTSPRPIMCPLCSNRAAPARRRKGSRSVSWKPTPNSFRSMTPRLT